MDVFIVSLIVSIAVFITIRYLLKLFSQQKYSSEVCPGCAETCGMEGKEKD